MSKYIAVFGYIINFIVFHDNFTGCGDNSGGANGFHHKSAQRQNSGPTDSSNHITINLNDIRGGSDSEAAAGGGPALTLPPKIELMKQAANHSFQRQYYDESIAVYNRAIIMCPSAAVLYSNRAAALLKRNW